ncbi:MAG: tetratricopeptide repeat protein, partial [Pseudobdellovibrionaceae bacterium]
MNETASLDMKDIMENFKKFIEENGHAIPNLLSNESHLLTAYNVYLGWASLQSYDSSQFDFLFTKEEFGRVMGDLALFSVLYYEYTYRVGTGSHVDYYTRGVASGDGGDSYYSHDTGLSQHKKMAELFEKLKINDLLFGPEMLQLIKDFKPKFKNNLSLGGKIELANPEELVSLDERYQDVEIKFTKSLNEFLTKTWGTPSLLTSKPAASDAEFDQKCFLACDVMQTGQLDQALAMFESLHNENPSSYVALWNCAVCSVELGQADKAIECLNKVLVLRPQH